jgi:hypothetical protein
MLTIDPKRSIFLAVDFQSRLMPAIDQGAIAIRNAGRLTDMAWLLIGGIVKGDRAYAPPSPQNPHPIADIGTVLHDSSGAPLKEQLFLLQQIAYACFANQPGQQGGPWQQIYTTKGLYNANSGPDIANAPWSGPVRWPAPVISGSPLASVTRPTGFLNQWWRKARYLYRHPCRRCWSPCRNSCPYSFARPNRFRWWTFPRHSRHSR